MPHPRDIGDTTEFGFLSRYRMIRALATYPSSVKSVLYRPFFDVTGTELICQGHVSQITRDECEVIRILKIKNQEHANSKHRPVPFPDINNTQSHDADPDNADDDNYTETHFTHNDYYAIVGLRLMSAMIIKSCSL